MYKFIKVPDRFNINIDFWEDNFWIKFIEPFKQLYDRDISDKKEVSSKDMWCLWLYCDPSYQNKIGKLKEDEKKSAILSYYPNFDFKDDIINQCIIKYDEVCLSEAARKFKRTLLSIERFQDLIEQQLEGEDLTLDTYIQLGNNRWQLQKGTAGQLADLKKKATQLWKDYEPIQRLFEEEQGNIQLYGGGKPTIIEEGGLKLIQDDN